MVTRLNATSADGADLSLYRSAATAGGADGPAILFVHGATFGGRPAFATPGYSWLDDCAAQGRAAYAVDVRGYGKSDRPAAMDAPPNGDLPVRAGTAAEDLTAALAVLRDRHDTVHLVGYSWGTMVAGVAFQSGLPVDSVTLYAPVYNPDPDRVDEFAPGTPPASCRTRTRAATKTRWDAHLGADPARYRDKDAFDAFWAVLHADQGIDAQVPTIEAPTGCLADLAEAARDGPVYDPEGITVPSLVVRGSLDRTATRADSLRLYDALGSDDREYAEISDGSHFLALERRRGVLVDRVAAFHERVEG